MTAVIEEDGYCVLFPHNITLWLACRNEMN